MVRRSFVQALRTTPLVLLTAGLFAHSATQAAPGQRCFPEVAPAITSCIDGRFLSYWEHNGGLAVFGYPLTEAQPEVNQDTNASYLTQYFERQRFEYHPENAVPYDILLGRLGADSLRDSGRDWQSLPRAAADSPEYIPETGHVIAGEFRDYWYTHGLDLGDPGISRRESLALLGYPISEPALETNSSGDTVLTQHFERARLEDHVVASGHLVLQGRLGSEQRERQAAALLEPSSTGVPTPTATAVPADAPPVPATPEADDSRDDDLRGPAPTHASEPEHPAPAPTAPADAGSAPESPAYPAPESPAYPAPEPPAAYPAPEPQPEPAPATPPSSGYPAPSSGYPAP
jgi:hypothetical protein